MIKHQRQRRNSSECFLATCAMLAGAPLAQVRTVATRAAKVRHWRQALNRLEPWKAGADAILSLWPCLEPIRVYYCDRRDLDIQVTECGEIPSCPDGRGAFLVHYWYDGFHAMALEDQIVYDPTYAGPETWTAWWKLDGEMVKEWAWVPIPPGD